MENTASQLLKDYVNSQNFRSTADIMEAMRELFRDALQQVMEVELEEKILGLYACGMSQKDIAEQIKSLYDVEISPELVSKISEKIMPEVDAW